MENQNQKNNQPLNKNLALICGTIIAISLIVSGAVLYSRSTPSNSANNTGNNFPSGQQQQPPRVASSVDIANVKIDGEPFVGNANAPIVIAYWFDYQCPFCKRFGEDSLTKIVDSYVKDGKVKIVFKDYQFIGSDSQTAGLAGRAVWEIAPDKYYQWHVAVFKKQDDENSGWGKKADILALTESLGIDSAKVDQLMTSKATEYQKAMDADKAEGTSFSINGTPAVIVGKQLISGAQPYGSFKSAIDLALASK